MPEPTVWTLCTRPWVFQIWLFLCGFSLYLYPNRFFFFFRSLETELLESFQKTLCVYTGNWVFFQLISFSLTLTFVCSVCATLSPKKQCINGRQNQNRACLNLSSRTFHMRQDNCISTLLLQRCRMTFSGNLWTLISTEISRSSSTSLLIHCCCGSWAIFGKLCC